MTAVSKHISFNVSYLVEIGVHRCSKPIRKLANIQRDIHTHTYDKFVSTA